MSLFEKLKNKRYDLQEKKKKMSSSASGGNNNSNKNISKSRRNIRKAIADLDATQPTNNNVNQDISQRRTAQDRQQQLFNRQYDAYDDGDLGNPNQSKTTVKQSEVSTKAKNKTPLKRGFEDVTKERIQKKDIPKTKVDLLKKRQEYGITYDKKLKRTIITKDGLEKFARKSLNNKQIDSGSNKPIKLTKADLFKARERLIGGKEIKDSKGKVIGTTTGKYGGRVSTNRKQQNFKQKLKNLSSKTTENLSKFSKNTMNRLKDPDRGFGVNKKGTRAGFGKFGRIIKNRRGLIGNTLIGGLLVAPFVKDEINRRRDKAAGKIPTERISSKNTTDTGPLYSTKTGKDIKFGFNASGKPPQGTEGSLFNKKVKSMVRSKLNTKEFDFRKK